MTNPALASGSVFLFGNALSLEVAAARAVAWHLFNPMDVAGLKCWTRIENLAEFADGDSVTCWPDDSGNENDLLAANAYRSSFVYRNAGTYRSPLPPNVAANPDKDLLTYEPVSGPQGAAILVEPGDALITADEIFNPDSHCLFVVACPLGSMRRDDSSAATRLRLTTNRMIFPWSFPPEKLRQTFGCRPRRIPLLRKLL